MNFAENFASGMAALGAQAIAADPTRGEREGIDAIRFANDDMVGWRSPDDSGERESHVGASLVRIAAEAAQRIKAIDADDTRTEGWKAEQREKVASDAAQRFAAARAEADKIVDQFTEADAREAVAPPLGAGDHAAALVDHECRAWLRSLDREALVALGKDLTDPKHARLVEAAMRSPIPLSPWIAEAMRAAWIESRLQADPQGARLRRQAAERVEWLGSIAAQVEGCIARMQPRSVAPIVQRVA